MDASAEHAARRPRARTGDGARLREELIDATIETLAGLADPALLSLRAVARTAGVAAPSVYLHFASLDELVAAVEQRLFGELEAQLAEAFVAAATPRAALLDAGRRYVRFALDRPLHYRVLMGQRRLRTGAGLARGDVVFTSLEGAVRAALPPGRDDARGSAQLLWASLHGLAELRANFPGFDWRPLDLQLETILDGLLAAPRGEAV